MKNPKGTRNSLKKGPSGRLACTLPVLDTAKSRLLSISALVAVCAEFLVDSIDGMVKGSGVSETFVGLILLPIVGNAAEVRCPPRKVLIAQHYTAVGAAIKDKMNLAIGVAVGSSVRVWLGAKRYAEEVSRFRIEECVLIGIYILCIFAVRILRIPRVAAGVSAGLPRLCSRG